MLNGLASAAKYYKARTITHGDIQPDTVHFNNHGEVVLLENPVLFPRNRELLGKLASNPNYVGPFSPLQMEALSKDREHSSDNPQATEIWSIGMTVLACVTGCRISFFYDYVERKIKFGEINVALENLRSRGYSNELIQLMRGMTEEEEGNRPSIENLVDSINRRFQRPVHQSTHVFPHALIDSPPQTPRELERLFSSQLDNSSVQKKDIDQFVEENDGLEESGRHIKQFETLPQEAHNNNHGAVELSRGQAALQNPNLMKILGHKMDKPVIKLHQVTPNSAEKLQPSKTVATFNGHNHHQPQLAPFDMRGQLLMPPSYDKHGITQGNSSSRASRPANSPLQRAFPNLIGGSRTHSPTPTGTFTYTTTMTPSLPPQRSNTQNLVPDLKKEQNIQGITKSMPMSQQSKLPQRSLEPIKAVNLYLNQPNTSVPHQPNQPVQAQNTQFVNLYGRPQSQEAAANLGVNIDQMQPQNIWNQPSFQQVNPQLINSGGSSLELSRVNSNNMKNLFDSITSNKALHQQTDYQTMPSWASLVPPQNPPQEPTQHNNFANPQPQPETIRQTENIDPTAKWNNIIPTFVQEQQNFTLPYFEPTVVLNPGLHQQVQQVGLPGFAMNNAFYPNPPAEHRRNVSQSIKPASEEQGFDNWLNPQNQGFNFRNSEPPKMQQWLPPQPQNDFVLPMTGTGQQQYVSPPQTNMNPRNFNSHAMAGAAGAKEGHDPHIFNKNSEQDQSAKEYMLPQQPNLPPVALQATRRQNMSLNNLAAFVPSGNMLEQPTTPIFQDVRASVGGNRLQNLFSPAPTQMPFQNGQLINLDFPKPHQNGGSMTPSKTMNFNHNMNGLEPPGTPNFELKRGMARRDLGTEEPTAFRDKILFGRPSNRSQDFAPLHLKSSAAIKPNPDILATDAAASIRASSREPQNMPLFQLHPRPIINAGKNNNDNSGIKPTRFHSVRDHTNLDQQSNQLFVPTQARPSANPLAPRLLDKPQTSQNFLFHNNSNNNGHFQTGSMSQSQSPSSQQNTQYGGSWARNHMQANGHTQQPQQMLPRQVDPFRDLLAANFTNDTRRY